MPESSTEAANLQAARRYLAALEAGPTPEMLAGIFTEDVVQEEFPNRLVPAGARRGLPELLEGARRGQTVMAAQRYEILNAIASGEHVALEVRWTGTLAIPIGSTPAGGEMRAHFGVFLVFRGGRIAAQRNYDCFEPF
jgi:ketosteroid isomerase-like protein